MIAFMSTQIVFFWAVFFVCKTKLKVPISFLGDISKTNGRQIYSYRLLKILTLLKVVFFEKSEATIKCQSGTYPRTFSENLHAQS